jgi:uncharacterized membrane protein
MQDYTEAKKFSDMQSSWNSLVSSKVKSEEYFDNTGTRLFLIVSTIAYVLSSIVFTWNRLEILVGIIIMSIVVVLPISILLFSKKYGPKLKGLVLIFVLLFSLTALGSDNSSSLTISYLVLSLVYTVTNLLSSRVLGKWTAKGRLFELKWNSFKRYLADYSMIEQHSPQSLIVWESFLVYGIVLCVADKVIKAMQLKIPDFEHTKNMGVFYYHPRFHHTMLNSFSAAHSTVTSHSSGGGRGFGGGGGGFGGGHGGGGSGAR